MKTLTVLDPSFAETVTAAGPSRADLAITLSAPASVHTGATLTLTATITSQGPSAAGKTLTTLAVPSGFTITTTGGGTKLGSTVLFTLPTGLPVHASRTYTITLTATHNTRSTGATIRAATVSVTRDPNYRNNTTTATIHTT